MAAYSSLLTACRCPSWGPTSLGVHLFLLQLLCRPGDGFVSWGHVPVLIFCLESFYSRQQFIPHCFLMCSMRLLLLSGLRVCVSARVFSSTVCLSLSLQGFLEARICKGGNSHCSVYPLGVSVLILRLNTPFMISCNFSSWVVESSSALWALAHTLPTQQHPSYTKVK